MGLRRGCGQLIFYNCRGSVKYAYNCTNSMRESCLYCTQFDYETEDCPTMIARLHSKGTLQLPLTQNLQMMRSESCEEDPNVKILLRRGITTRDDKGKQS